MSNGDDLATLFHVGVELVANAARRQKVGLAEKSGVKPVKQNPNRNKTFYIGLCQKFRPLLRKKK